MEVELVAQTVGNGRDRGLFQFGHAAAGGNVGNAGEQLKRGAGVDRDHQELVWLLVKVRLVLFRVVLLDLIYLKLGDPYSLLALGLASALQAFVRKAEIGFPGHLFVELVITGVLAVHAYQRLVLQKLQTPGLWEEGILEVANVPLDLANYVELVVFDFDVQSLLVGQELGFEWLVEYLKRVIREMVPLLHAAVIAPIIA